MEFAVVHSAPGRRGLRVSVTKGAPVLAHASRDLARLDYARSVQIERGSGCEQTPAWRVSALRNIRDEGNWPCALRPAA